MNKLSTRIWSILLIIVMILGVLPASALAAETMTLAVSSKNGLPGSTVEVDVSLVNNPGVASLGMYVVFDENLTLEKVTYNSAMGGQTVQPQTMTSPAKLTWVNYSGNVSADCVFATLTFRVSKEAENGDTAEIGIEYDPNDIYNYDLDNVYCAVEKGIISIKQLVGGDINGDGVNNMKDVTWMFRYLANWDIEVNDATLDCNGSGSVNNKDLTRLMQYTALWDVPIYVNGELYVRCIHEMTYTAAKAATCAEEGNTAYYHCSKCDKYYTEVSGINEIKLADTVVAAKGHTLVEVPGYEPTYEEEGLTTGYQCSVCGAWDPAQTVIPPLEHDKYYVTYQLAGSDSYLKDYLKTVDVATINLNPDVIDTTYSAYELKPISKTAIPGYEFVGWVNGYGETVRTIGKGTTGSMEIFAQWEKTEYEVVFDSPLFPKENVTRTIDQVYYLPQNMEWDHYVFMGWSDASGRIIESIKPGTQDITVHANWTSNRSQAKANDYLKDGPIIIEDQDAKKYHFVYDLGMIVNVPLETIVDLGYRSSLGIEETVTTTVTLEKTEASSLNSSVENATTNSSSWTLSKDWNELLTDVTGGEKEVSSNETVALSTGSSQAYNSSGSTYTGNSFHASQDNLTTAKTVTDDSWKVGAEVSAGVPIGPVKLEAKVSGEVAHSKHQEDYSENKSNLTLDASWNSTQSYSNSGSFEQHESLTTTVMESAKDTWQHEISKSIGGSDSSTTSDSVTNKKSDGYSSSMSYHTVEETVTVEKISSDASTTPGYYRYVLAGDYYVYAIVTYDVATGTYSVINHSVLADNTRKLLDYSKSDPLYQDYNNAVLPFEVPIDVHNYIFDALATTDGLVIDRETGMVTEYDGDAKNVFVPDYQILDNGDGTVATVVKVTGIEADVFKGNENIELVKLGKYITDVPAEAFMGCASLKEVRYDTLVSIGKNAFSGCTSLENFTVETTVKTLGDGAFDGAKNVVVNAYDSNVAKAAITGSAKSLTLNLNSMADTLENAELDIKATERATVNGYGKTFNNVNIKSVASETVLNRMTFTGNKKTPLKLNSSKVTLNQVKVENAPGLALVLEQDAVLTLQGKCAFTSARENVILCRSMELIRQVAETTELNIADKNILICGTLTDEKGFLKVNSTEQIISISEEDFAKYLDSHYVRFDANGGVVAIAEKLVLWNTEIGELPVPTRDYYTFNGWFDSEGNAVTAETVMTATEDITLTAKWTQNPVSGWVLASKVPAGAETVNEKWTYDLTTRTTSSSSSLAGYTQYQDPTWVWGSYGSWSSWSTNAAYASDSRQVETNTVAATYKTQYNYHRYTDSTYYWTSWGKGTFSGYYCHIYQETGWLDYALDWKATVDGSHNRYGTYNGSNYWYDERTRRVEVTPAYTQYRYRDRSKIYTYYFSKTEAKESSTAVTASDTISNVQHYVQYRAK